MVLITMMLDLLVRRTSGHIGWADVIFAMEKKHVRRLKDKFGVNLSNKKVICLGIPDDYQYMDEELIEYLNLECPSTLMLQTRGIIYEIIPSLQIVMVGG